MKKLLFTRKFNKETYKFYLKNTYNGDFILVETPENCFGYPDKVLFNNGNPYTLYRYLPQWILNSIKKAVETKGFAHLIY